MKAYRKTFRVIWAFALAAGLRARAEGPLMIRQTRKERKVLIMWNKRTKLNIAILLMAAVLGYGMIGKAGNLEPSAAPAPTMKTLD